jgi:hypothetical protein
MTHILKADVYNFIDWTIVLFIDIGLCSQSVIFHIAYAAAFHGFFGAWGVYLEATSTGGNCPLWQYQSAPGQSDQGRAMLMNFTIKLVGHKLVVKVFIM